MSKLKDHLNEMFNNTNNPNDIAKNVEGTIEDILFQLESIADMDALGFNTSKKVHKAVVNLRKLGHEIVKDIKTGQK